MLNVDSEAYLNPMRRRFLSVAKGQFSRAKGKGQCPDMGFGECKALRGVEV